jgi:hypothetical protein
MIRLIGLVVSIAIADSVNPSTVGPALYLASGPQPRRKVIELAADVGAVFLLDGAALMLGPGEALLVLVPHPGPKARYIAETASGDDAHRCPVSISQPRAPRPKLPV